MKKIGLLLVKILFLSSWCFGQLTGVKNEVKVFEVDGRYGFKNKTGEVVIKPIYFMAYDFFEERAAVYNEGWKDDRGYMHQGKWGYIDKSGKLIIPFIYDDATSFRFGGAIVRKNGKYGIIDTTGKTLLPFNYDCIWYSSDGIYKINIGGGKDADYPVKFETTNGMIGFIDRVDGGKWGIVNMKEGGKIVVDTILDFVASFEMGFAMVQSGGKWGYIDKKGEIVIPLQFDDVRSFQGKNKYPVADVKLNGKWGMINVQGKFIIHPIYDKLISVNKYVYVTLDKKEGVLDTTGKMILKIEFDDVVGFSQEPLANLAHVVKNGQQGFYNEQGKEVVPLIYDDAEGFSPSYDDNGKSGPWMPSACVKKDGKYGLVDTMGKLMAPLIYEEPLTNYLGMYHAKKDGKYGFLDQYGNVIIPFIYDEVKLFLNGSSKAKAKLNGQWIWIDKKGNKVE